MVIGEEDGSDSFSDDRGSDDSSGWRLRGWAASAARGRSGRGRAWGDVGSGCARGRVQSESRSRKVGRVSREGGGVAVGGRDAGGGFGCVSREGGFGTRRERGVRVGARREERGGSRFIWQTGCCENAGATATATATARATGQDGDRQRQHPRRGTASAASATRTATTTATARTGTATTATVGGRGLSAETWAAIRPSGSKVRLGTKFAIEDSSSDRDDGSNFSDEGDSDSISDDPEQRRQRGPGQQRQRRRQRGAMASCVEGTSRATSERDRTTDSNAGWPHRVVRRRFDVDETRTVFGTVREEGAWPGGGHAVGDTSRASKCLGALELQRERVGWVGRAGDTPPGCRRRTVQGGECGKEHITVSSGLELHD